MRWKLAAGWVLAQVLFFAGWAAVEEHRRSAGDSILVRTAPVDPRDLLSGQYQALSYDFSRSMPLRDAGGREAEEGEAVWVLLRPEGEFHIPLYALAVRPADLPPGCVAIAGRRERGRLVFGIERYFVPEGTETPSQSETTVRLRVGPDGTARILQVLVHGKPWP